MTTFTGEEIMASGRQGFQFEFFTIAQQPQSQFTLMGIPARDADNDPILIVKLNGVSQQRGVDYSLSGAIITWTSPVSLEAGEILEVIFQPS